ncbi:CHAT domain-containing protein [Trichocoleus sp. FACHB-591]|uniref:nSTAND1 domain-containing NTPase n=1 Tax=Trichocoleus sp. FACHB-591 TaxID=2692872 RepID=UPI001688D64C|nr:CHAT domain-containing protein [Trichocoleus sp. FACHB-591]MBD2096470.1 CHAT domain-containing protein [Trichocoleus sp. FACHB-591]
MGKLVVFKLGAGDFERGFPVTLQIGVEGDRPSTEITGFLPPNPTILEDYQRWQTAYLALGWQFNLRIEVPAGQVNRVSFTTLCQDAAEALSANLNHWLSADSFRPVREKLLEKLSPADLIRLILQVEDLRLRRLPWHRWDFFERYPNAELALSAPGYERLDRPAIARDKIRILAVLGNRAGIDTEADRQLLAQLPSTAEVVFLVEPNRRELNQQLWDTQGWDILFFAGHSASQADGATGQIAINPQQRLGLGDLKHALQQAIAQGLQLAIFNSCDGLGLAHDLQALHIPQMIVMREPVPDLVAQEFLKAFLTSFTQGAPLYLAVRQAREQLQGLEDEFPCASWLPVICQNPAELPMVWQPKTQSVDQRVESVPLAQIPPCPYRGLAAFQESDTPFFFGREAFINKLLRLAPTQPLITIAGPSGSGKSSVVAAGLIPRLRTEGDWLICSLRPSQRPFLRLAEQFVMLLEPDRGETEQLLAANQLAAALQQGTVTLPDVIEQILYKYPTAKRSLLLVDQFEELYTLCQLDAERQQFLDQLLALLPSGVACTLVLTLRADFLESALAYRPFADALSQFAPELIGPMSTADLEAAIALPAALMKVKIADGLTIRILESISQAPGNLPLLEFALTLLWERQQQGELTHAAYDAIGGVNQALAVYAEQVYAKLAAFEQKQVQRLLTQLVRPGEGGVDIRRLATRSEIGETNWPLVRRLADARLVVTNRSADGIETAEVVHEALIREWQRLRQWMEEVRTFRLWQERLRSLIRQWQVSDRDDGALLRGAPLLEAQFWLQEQSADLRPEEQAFIQRSLAYQHQEQSERHRSRRRVIFGLSLGLFGSLGLGAIAAWQWERAEIQTRNAQLSARSFSSEALLASDKAFDALLEALRAGNQLQHASGVTPTTRIRVASTLLQALYTVQERQRLEQHRDSVTSVSFSPNGQILASASADRTILLWRLDGTLQKTISGHRDRVTAVQFSPDGKLIGSSSADQTVRLWQADGKPLQVLRGHAAAVTSVSFSPDNKILASGSTDGKIKLWQRNGTPLKTWTAQGDSIQSLSFSPQGQTLASAHGDGSIKVWRLNGTLQQTLKGHKGTVNMVRFSPNGQLLASASNDQKIRLWHVDGAMLQVLSGHRAAVTAISFSSDGKRLASVGGDRTVKLWNLKGKLLQTLPGHSSRIETVSFSPDGQLLASGSGDRTVKLWQLQRRASQSIGDRSNITSLSPSSRPIAAGSRDGLIQLWQPNGKLLHQWQGHAAPVYSIRFSPNGKTLASASGDGTVKLWRQDGTLLITLTGHNAAVYDVSFSPDGQTLASASFDHTVRLWNSTGKLLHILWGHQDLALTVRFSPDGQTLASAGKDSTIRLWRQDGSPLKTLEGHNSSVLAISFSPNGQMLASASADNLIKLWSIDGRLLSILRGHSNTVTSIGFSADGQTLVSGSADNTVKLWSLDGTLLKTLQGYNGSVFGATFGLDNQQILSVSNGKVVLWSLELDWLMQQGCDWVSDYLRSNPTVHARDRQLCPSSSPPAIGQLKSEIKKTIFWRRSGQ